MQLIEDNWEYVRATATAKAVEIAQHTGRPADIEDYTQEILLHLATHANLYDRRRSQPRTFINMLMRYAKKDILRRMYRQERRTIIDAITIEQCDQGIIDDSGISETVCDMKDFIDACLQENEQALCRAVLFEGESIAALAKRTKQDKIKIAAIIRLAMQPFAESIGIHAPVRFDGEVTEGQPPDDIDDEQAGRSTEAATTLENQKGTTETRFSGLPPGKYPTF